MNSRIPYKLLMALLVFSIVLIAPFSIITYHSTLKMMDAIDDIEPLSSEQQAVRSQYMDDLSESLVSMSFYAFIVAFVLAVFFSRRILLPVKELYRGMLSVKEGRLDVRLDVGVGDELADVTKAFNEMADTLRARMKELHRKESYVNEMLDPLWVVDEDNFIVDVNPAFTRLFGYERDEVLGASIFDFLDEKSDRVMREQLRGRDKGESTSYEVSIISKREGLIPVLISGAPIIEEGNVVGKLGIIKDFREEKKLRDTLRREMDFTDAIMQSMSDGMMVIDRDFRVVKANMAAIANAGRDLAGESCHRAYHGHQKERCYVHGETCPVKTVFDTGVSFRTVHEHIVDGVPVFHDIVAYPIKDPAGEVRYVVEILSDVTEHRKLDEEVALKNRELITLNSVSRILSQSLKAEDIFNNILDKVIELTGMDGGGIYLIDELGKKLECKYQRGLSDDFIRSVGVVRIGQDLPGRVALTGQSVVLPDITKAEIGGSTVLRHSGIKGYVCTPVRGKEKLLGVFYLFSFEPHVFSPEEERILDSISEMTGIAYENIRLYEKMRDLYRQQRLRRENEQKNLLGLSSMLSATLDLQSVLSASLSLVKEASGADFVWLLEVDARDNLTMKAASEGGVSDGAVIYTKEHDTIERAAMRSGEPAVYSRIKDEKAFHVAEGVRDYSTACSIPIHVGDKTLGALTLYYTMLKEPREDEIHFLQTVGSILAVAMERARLYEDVIIERGMASTILEGIADGVMTVDMFEKVISMNRAAEEIIGIMPRSAVGMKRSDVFGFSDENGPLQRKMSEGFHAATKGELRTSEADLVDMNGRRIPLMFKSAPVRDNRGEIIGVAYVLRDLRREKELDMLKTEFVKAVSHEFRTPLATIVGMTEMVLDEEVSGRKAREYLEAIFAEGNRLSVLVSDVLDVAKIESGKEVFSESEVDLGSLLEDIRESFEHVIREKRIRFSAKVGRGIKGFRADREKLKRLLSNLIDNSLTYTDDGKAVAVEVRKLGGKVRIIVRDEGWGIPEDDLKHAGEKFYRGVHAVRTTGTGLGLALCKDIARMHGGDIHIESRPGVGTTVTVELPTRRKK